jgi:ATP-binding cassette subfamily B protein RaxB
MAYNTLVGFLGSTLSAGQQQRILIARALYHQPSILLLDEATSHLDVRLEAVILRALAELSITRVIVAHRPETLAMADRVLGIEAGRIAASQPRRDAAGHQPCGLNESADTLPFALQAPTSAARAVLGSLGC